MRNQVTQRTSTSEAKQQSIGMRKFSFYIYIMASTSMTLYTGVSNSLYNRVLQHKSGEYEGFASKYHCNRLVYYEEFTDIRIAIAREKQVKSYRREKKLAMIAKFNPRFEDLAQNWGDPVAFPQEKMAEVDERLRRMKKLAAAK